MKMAFLRPLWKCRERLRGIVKKWSVLAFAVLAVMALLLTTLLTGVVFAYRVIYNGDSIALVRNKATYEEAITLARDMVDCADFDEYTVSPVFTPAITVENNLSSTDELALSIINHTESIQLADALTINGLTVAAVSVDEHLSDYVNRFLDSQNPTDCDQSVSEFVDLVTVQSVYTPHNNLTDLSFVNALLLDLSVRTTVTTVTQTAIPYNTISRKSADRPLGDISVAVRGVNGVLETTTRSVYLNGVLQSCEELQSTVVSEPVDQISLIGTMRPASSLATVSQVNALGLIWPLKRVQNQVISAYFGDGRNHKGVDIASPKGTPIYAGQSGTVVTAQYSASYGNYVVIDHGNGFQTLYAHASQLYVKAGDYVVQGQVIALVGSTGNSTGNHLHIEVIKDSVKLNPAPFLGI